MIVLVLGIIICILLVYINKLKKKIKENDYSELIKRCFEETNKDLTNLGKKKHSNKN